MGFDVSRFVKSVDDHYLCAICQEVLEDPTGSSSCKNEKCAFCKNCIRAYLNKRQTCPSCRQSLTVDDLYDMKPFQRILNNLEVRCSFCHLGCTVIDKLGNIANHEKFCDSNPSKMMSCVRCRQECSRLEMEYHNCFEELHRKLDAILYTVDSMNQNFTNLLSESLSTLKETIDDMVTLKMTAVTATPSQTANDNVENSEEAASPEDDDVDDRELDRSRRTSKMKELVLEITQKLTLPKRIELVLLNVDRGNFCNLNPYSDRGVSQTPKLELYAQMLSALNRSLKGDCRVLCLGAARGYFPTILAALVGPGGSVVVLDNKQSQLDLAKKNIDSERPELLRDRRIRLECNAEVSRYPGSASFDVIFDFFTRDEFPEELAQQLRNGGSLVFYDKKQGSWEVCESENGGLKRSKLI